MMKWFATKALFGAIRNRDYDAARIAITKGADPNGTHKGWTPLVRACHTGDHLMISLLIAAGADPRKPVPSGGVDAYGFCQQHGYTALAEHMKTCVENREATQALGVDPWKQYRL